MRYWKPRKVLGSPLVGIGVASYLNGDDAARRACALETLVHSFRAQTYQNWRLLIVHDGPITGIDPATLQIRDDRVQLHATKDRKKQFGHPHRQWAIDTLVGAGCDWLGLTNDDNYYAPCFLEWMLSIGTNPKHPRQFVYCDLVHSHKLWRPIVTEPRRGKLDLGAWLARAGLVRKVKFDDFNFDGDGKFIDKLRIRAAKSIEKVPAVLFTHN